MLIVPFLAPLVVFFVRDVIVKFVVFVAVFALVAILVPVALGYLTPFIGVGSLSNAFADLSGGVWFFLDFFQLGFGIPLLISAWITRFLIRRLPIIG